MKPRVLLLLMLMPLALFGQTVSCTITDAATGETLIGATVLDDATGNGTTLPTLVSTAQASQSTSKPPVSF